MIESRTLQFWRWVRALAERKIRTAYMEQFKHDRKCTNCNQWGALGGFDWNNLRHINSDYEGLTCTNCGHESIWYMGSMLPIPVSSEHQLPLSQYQFLQNISYHSVHPHLVFCKKGIFHHEYCFDHRYVSRYVEQST